MIDSVRGVGSLAFLALALLFLLLALVRGSWRGFAPSEQKENLAFVAVGCVLVAVVLAPEHFLSG